MSRLEILRNSIWDIRSFDGVESGLWRILLADEAHNFTIMYPINDSKKEKRPILVDFDAFKHAISEHYIFKGSFKLPVYMLKDDSEISEQHIKIRDENYALIKELVDDQDLLIKLSTVRRVNSVGRHADKVGAGVRKIHRLLKQFYKYGQTRNALLPAYSACGGLGKTKIVKTTPLGSPKKARTLTVERTNNFIVTDVDKSKFRKILKKHYFKAHGKPLSDTYKEMLRTYYSDEIKMANALGSVPYVPSLRQLSYWKRKLFSDAESIRLTTTERDYLLNRREVMGSASTKWSVPGDCFEIDATVADAHIVSEWSPNLILGRPTIYSIVDRASGAICGINVSLFYASWRAARQALANAFLPKVSYCKEFGIDIQDSDWPIHHIPLTLMCDNGEMIGLQPQKLVVPLTELQLSPPYRPDFKSFVENRFGLLNKELIHDLLGTTRGGKVVRGDKDPRKDAIYTLKDFTKLLINAVLELNRSKYDRLAESSPLLIKHNLTPNPINFWKINVLNHKHSLQIANESEVISRMYPPAKSTMTERGIEFNGLYYSCERVIKDNLAAIARTNGSWKLDARINENTTNYMYVRFNKNDDFVKCNLLPRSNMFESKPMYEVEVFQDWREQKDAETPITVESIDSSTMRKEKEKSAKATTPEKPAPFSQRVKNIRENRKNEINNTSNVIDDSRPTEPLSPESVAIDSAKKKTVFLPRRPKGK